MSDSPEQTLPLAAPAPPERADAARNRRRVLAAAQRLFAEHGPAGVSMEAVAREAGVGKATVFRRFRDRHALVAALLDEHERVLQDALLSGPPPLGPGAPPLERALAFLDRLLELSIEYGDLLLASETAKPLSRQRTGAYAAWHLHLAALARELRPGADAELLAHQLLAGFDAELLHRLLVDDGVSPDRLRAAQCDAARRLLAP